MTELNPCEKVRTTCIQYIQNHDEHVTIDRTAIPALAKRIEQQSKITWDDEAWHYDAPSSFNELVRKERMALYILALDAINFCFWPLPGYEYANLACSLTGMASQDHDAQETNSQSVSDSFILSARSLSEMKPQTMKELFEKHDKQSMAPPDIETRCQLWNQVGNILLERFHGSAWSLIQSADGSATKLVQLLIDHFEGFCDFRSDIWFLKRAQICVGDWNASLQLHLKDLSQLTTFADYRVPQLLRHFEIMNYAPELATRIDQKEELVKDGPEENAIRAATVAAVEYIVEELQTLAPDKVWTAVETDWYLWQVGERMQNEGELSPHHRVRTIYY
ncbi:hypothetical protein MPSEU_000141000 [Mayamaea pseudoterrestris]|nr:hypothetical protein MPSEU_000141000 [Mayamaea pseudoterrestris]